MFSGIAQTQRTNGVDDDDFKFVAYFRNEATNLFHQTIDGTFGASFQKRRYGQCRYTSILISDQLFQVNIAASDSRWMGHSHLQSGFVFVAKKFTENSDIFKFFFIAAKVH